MYADTDRQSNNLAKAVITMSLKDVLVTPEKHKPASWYDSMKAILDKEDLEWLDACLDNKALFSGPYIAEKLTLAGYPVSSTTINNTRKQRNG
jgi:hypothetical protein